MSGAARGGDKRPNSLDQVRRCQGGGRHRRVLIVARTPREEERNGAHGQRVSGRREAPISVLLGCAVGRVICNFVQCVAVQAQVVQFTAAQGFQFSQCLAVCAVLRKACTGCFNHSGEFGSDRVAEVVCGYSVEFKSMCHVLSLSYVKQTRFEGLW